MQLENTVLYLMANRTHIWLDNAPLSQVICAVEPESDKKAINQFDVARKKHFSMLGKAMIDWTEYLSSRLYSLSDLYYLTASPEFPMLTQQTESSCKTLSILDFQECNINTQLSFELSRRLLEENHKKIYEVDIEISRIKKFATENCGNNDQIVSAVVSILAELKVEIMHEWEIDELLADIFRIPVVTVSDWDIIKCAQESTHQKLSELEAVWKVYLMHNLKVKKLREIGELMQVKKVERIMLKKFLYQSPVRDPVNHKISIRKVEDDNVNEERGAYDRIFEKNRSKRWVWTDFLSQATGLSRIKDVKGVADNQEKIRFTQIKDEQEILKIEKEENSLLKEIKDSEAKLEDLFRDEKIVSEKLKLWKVHLI